MLKEKARQITGHTLTNNSATFVTDVGLPGKSKLGDAEHSTSNRQDED
jgi:hypothetical protein